MQSEVAPADEQILELLGNHVTGADPVELRRSRYHYATSAPLEEIRVRTRGREGPPLILKDLSRGRLIGDAAGAKPPFLYEPRREIETYRRILAPAGIGPGYVASSSGGEPAHHWLVIEKAPGVELWQIGETATWHRTARWLGGMHARFAGSAAELQEANPHLLVRSRSWFRSWCERARFALAASDDPRAPALVDALGSFDEIAAHLAELPVTLVHGEFYPSNILVEVDGGELEVRPVDWEMAGLGPGLIDLAALAGGWDEGERSLLFAAYREGLEAAGGTAAATPTTTEDLNRCRLHLALQWIGWAREWRPPREHRQDWLGEAQAVAEELGLR